MEKRVTVEDLAPYMGGAVRPVVRGPWSVQTEGAGEEVRRPPETQARNGGREGTGAPGTGALSDGLEEELARELEEMLEVLPEGPAVSRLTLNHEAGTFDFPDGRAENSIEGFLAKVEPRRARFEDGRVACLSRDGKVGRLVDMKTEISCEECRRCPLSARVYFVPSDLSRELWYFDMPSSQLGSLVRYVNSVAYGEGGEGKAGTHPCRVVTRVRLKKREGRRAARLVFEKVRDASDEEVREARSAFKELYPLAAEGGTGPAGGSPSSNAGGLDSVEF
ncbi:hypothetical protein [Desulfovirgula thermocuniculi]|uniref:hypothetical protein n=1 Tax=Desulfovirgula thermocuniculi TaxID=348842 RepID=UPI0012EBF72B|nr:hypothetical protein [Desulfovirgula thermocuniculi]